MTKRILLIDDEPDLAMVARVRLESAGYEVWAEETAEGALARLQNNIPDLILLDILLPKMQGEELCKILKSDDRFKHLPIILFTASASDMPKVTKESGADGYITKPYEPKELLEMIKKLGNWSA